MSALILPPVARGVDDPLLAYLQDSLRLRNLSFAENPTLLPEGRETNIYRFQLRSQGPLPLAFTPPLILRAYSSRFGLPRLRREFAAQQFLAEAGYPVARPLLFERSAAVLGGPFLVMNLVPGQTMLAALLHRFTNIWWAPGHMAEMHARLHALPAADFPCPPGRFLERRLREMHRRLREYDLDGLMPGLDWLRDHRPEAPEMPSILHLDFHPMNLLFDRGCCRGVLDWCEADAGDRHADVASTLMLLDTAPLEGITVAQRLAALAGRSMLRRRYLRAYRRFFPVDRGRLCYFKAWAALQRLCRWGTWIRAGPLITGSKPSVMRFVTPEQIALLERYFQHQAGVAVCLGAPLAA
jgi:aminoglycoside phosphotransferase (APT) family kinase protein